MSILLRRDSKVDMSFGKHKDKAVAWLLLTKPDYFMWMKQKGMQDKPEYRFMLNLVQKLNSKPFNKAKCNGTCNGANTPTRLSLYKGIFNLEYWFCDECDPYSQGAMSGTLSTVSKYEDIIRHRQSQTLIKTFSRAKGVPERKTKKALQEYFDYQ